MSIEVLQTIFAIENDLLKSEQLEQEKISVWLAQEKERILQHHEQQLAELEEKKRDFRVQVQTKAEKRSGQIVEEAKIRARNLQNLDEDFLQQLLKKALTSLFGHET